MYALFNAARPSGTYENHILKIMKILVLGSAAGGGFPQWNCNCPNCAGLRNGTINAKARTQSSIAVSSHVLEAMRQADCVLVDGTVWTADEMITLGLTQKTAADMGHLQLSGPGGMIEVLDSVGARRKVLIHINNTNPILNEDASERSVLAQHGIEVAYDGMQIDL